MTYYPDKAVPLIIVGRQRAGTRYLTDALNALPQVCLQSELPNPVMRSVARMMTQIENYYRRSAATGGARRDREYGRWRNRREELLFAIWKNAGQSSGQEPDPNCRYFGYKRPNNEFYFEFYESMFEKRKPIYAYCIRDFIENYLSVKSRWPEREIGEVADQYLRSVHQFEKMRAAAGERVLLFNLNLSESQGIDYIDTHIVKPLGLALTDSQRAHIVGIGRRNTTENIGKARRRKMTDEETAFVNARPELDSEFRRLAALQNRAIVGDRTQVRGVPASRETVSSSTPLPKAFKASLFEQIAEQMKQRPDLYYCPVCGEASKKFNDGGVGKRRKNARCPTCGSLERHRVFWVCFVNVVWPKLPHGKKKLLHVAPEKVFTELLVSSDEINYLSGDLMMPQAMVKLDLTDIQFENNTFDIIICSHILEHIPEDRKAMAEMFRVTKPGGFLLIMVPTYGNKTYEDFSITSPDQRAKHFGQDDHVRKYGMDIMGRLSHAGYTVRAWPTPDELGEETIKFIAAGRRIVFECRKDA